MTTARTEQLGSKMAVFVSDGDGDGDGERSVLCCVVNVMESLAERVYNVAHSHSSA